MSADNWTVCPRCKYRHSVKRKEARDLANNSYGLVPLEKWQELDAAAQALVPEYTECRFREDYEISGAEDGCIDVEYRGHCDTCGLSVRVDHQHIIDWPEV